MPLFTNNAPKFWPPRLAPPPNERVQVDWQHPLSAGLIGCYVASQGDGTVIRNLAGYGGDLKPWGAAQPLFAPGPFGIEAVSGMSGGSGFGWSGALPTAMQPANQVSIFWYGGIQSSGINTGGSIVFGARYNSAGASPYIPYGLDRDAGTGVLALDNADGNNFHRNETPSIALTAGSYYNVVGTIDTTSGTGNKSILYNAGVAGTTATAGTATLNYTTSSTINIGGDPSNLTASSGGTLLIGCVWKRILSAAEAGWLAQDPFAMVRPVAQRRIYLSAAPAILVDAGTGTATFGAMGAQGTASAADPATGTATLGAFTSGGTAASGPNNAQATASFPPVGVQGQGGGDNRATATLVYGALGVQAVATTDQFITGTATLPSLGASGAATQIDAGQGTATAGGLGSQGQVTQTVAAAGTGTFAGPQAQGALVQGVVAQGGGTFGGLGTVALPPRAVTTDIGQVFNTDLVNPTLDQLFQGFLDLMPRGAAWPKEEDSVMRRILRPLLNTYLRLIQRDNNLLIDAFPSTTTELLPEWESSLGLPDPCLGDHPTIAQRRGQVVARLVAGGGQSVAFFIQYAAQLGYSISIEQFTPAVAGVACAGTADYGEAWAHAWRVHSSAETVFAAKAGAAHAGDPLRSWGNNVLECEFKRLSPYHTYLLFSYDL